MIISSYSKSSPLRFIPGRPFVQSECPVQTAAVAVVSLMASERLRCRILELVMVSKCESGTHPRCRSDSRVPSTQSGRKKGSNKKLIIVYSPIIPGCIYCTSEPFLREWWGKLDSEIVLRSLLCWCTRMMSAFSNESSSGWWPTIARIHCICVKSVWTQEERSQTYNQQLGLQKLRFTDISPTLLLYSFVISTQIFMVSCYSQII